MNESNSPLPSHLVSAPGEPPSFGAVDIVEAFTAMRHEWRVNTRETRTLAEKIQEFAANLHTLESKLANPPTQTESPNDSKQLALLLADTEHQLSRAIEAMATWEKNQSAPCDGLLRGFDEAYERLNPVARWFAKPLFAAVSTFRQRPNDAPIHPGIEGLTILLNRLRQRMGDWGIARMDVLGEPFDGDLMRAIGSMETSQYPQGHVAEQLSPGYLWHGAVLRYADVRVAKANDTKSKSET